MDDQQSSQITDLKEKILAEIQPLIPQIQDPTERFHALSGILRENWSDALANDAFEAAKSIQDPEEKMRSLQSLMSELSYRDHKNEPPPATN
jgi:hypothetical protein